MKRQMKIAAVVSATALLAIGASFTSMAAAKTGTWKNEDGTWYCYDKNDDVYTNEFCMSNGVELYVGEEGELVTNSWVEYDGNMYYIGSAGTKTVNAWKLLTPYEDADEEWYYFATSGKRVENTKKVISGKTYYFDGEGKNLTGWINTANKTVKQAEKGDDETSLATLVYTDENGARVTNDWFKAYEPGIDVEEDDLDLFDEYWYYAKALGAPKTGKASSIDGETYLFDVTGKMLSGWIVEAADDVFVEIDNDNDDEKALSNYKNNNIYYACPEDGHVKKNKWIKEWNNINFKAADPDTEQKWFWLQKDGTVFVPTTASEANAVDFVEGALDIDNGTPSNATFKTINNEVYLFNEDGEMMYDLVSIEGDIYYFGGKNDGARKIGAQTIADDMDDSYKFFFGTEDNKVDGYKKGVGVTGAKNGKLYKDGLLVTASGDYKYAKVTLDGVGAFIVNKSGSIQTSKKSYSDDGHVVYDATNDTFVTTPGVKKGSIQ